MKNHRENNGGGQRLRVLRVRADTGYTTCKGIPAWQGVWYHEQRSTTLLQGTPDSSTITYGEEGRESL